MRSNSRPLHKKVLLPIYFPWILAEIVQYHSVLSYFIAWAGSFLIFYLTIFSSIRCQNNDLPTYKQVMRPIILIQLIFAGFMCCTSIFYFMNHMGYEYFKNIHTQSFNANELTMLIAKCQRLTLLAHTALTTGIILLIKPTITIKYYFSKPKTSLLVKFCLLTYSISVLLNYLPSLIQFKYNLVCLSASCGTFILITGLVRKKGIYIAFGSFIFSLNFLNATLTGYKEQIITTVILLFCLAIPYYKRTVLILLIPTFFIILYTLPTFTSIIRLQSWSALKTKEMAREDAYQILLNDDNNLLISKNNWDFLTNRFSEINMFCKYIKYAPDEQAYNFQIINNTLYALIPRAFWRNKPNTEKLAMERVYNFSISKRASKVSAKTRPVVDGYLTAGIAGVYIYMLLYGLLCQALCNLAEQLFGGYQAGCVILFNSIFQQLWRGNTLEFLLNNILYGYLLMLLIFWIMRISNCLKPLTNYERYSNQSFL